MEMWPEAQERYHEAAQLIDSPKFNLMDTLPAGWEAEAKKLKIACWLNEAICHVKSNYWNEAITCSERVLALESTNVKALFRRGSALMGKQEYQAARKDLAAAAELAPKNVEIRNMLGVCKMASRAADRKQMAELGSMFGGKAGELYKGVPQIPQWRGPLPTAWLDVSIDGVEVGRIVIELFAKHVPRSAENFRSLCTGERGHGKHSKMPLHYQGTPFHRAIPGFMVQGGDIVKGSGMGGECIWGAHFADENLDGLHDVPGVVSMANAGPNSNSSQFFITTIAAPHLDKKHVVVGHVIEGMDVVHQIQNVQTDSRDVPMQRVLVSASGTDCKSPIPFEAEMST